MADNTDTTRPGEADAGATVMPYLCVSGSAEHCGAHRAVCEPAAEAIVAAVYPVIEAAGYERGCTEFKSRILYWMDHAQKMTDAAREAIAERDQIAAAVREQAAQDIEAMDEPYWDTDGAEVGWSWARDDAARIVRGGR